jgi:hypothetical protein
MRLWKRINIIITTGCRHSTLTKYTHYGLLRSKDQRRDMRTAVRRVKRVHREEWRGARAAAAGGRVTGTYFRAVPRHCVALLRRSSDY